jgi:hypothetical protein
MSHAAALAAIAAMKPRLGPNRVLGEFLDLVGRASPLGPPGWPLQAVLVQAALACLPPWTISQLTLPDRPARRAGAIVAMKTLALAAATDPLPIVRDAYARVGVASTT